MNGSSSNIENESLLVIGAQNALATKLNLPGNAERCLQCHKCTAGCPLSNEMDFKPSQIVRLVQLNHIAPLLNVKAIWLCTSCHTCAARCPAGVDLSRIQDALRHRCRESGMVPADLRAAVASEAMLTTIANDGRMNELSLMRRYKLETQTLFERFSLGIALFFRGKLKLIKNKSRSRKQLRKLIRRIFPLLGKRLTE